MKRLDTVVRGLAVSLAALVIGCGGSFEKKELFTVYDEDGRANYYRITVQGRGTSSKVDYRAGWYDQQAVDSLFGDVAARASLQAKLAEKHEQIVDDAFKKYLEALRDGKADEISQARARFEEAMNAISGITPAGADRSAALDYAGKKFVMVLSTNPDKIIAAIQGRIQKQGLIDALSRRLQLDEDAKAGAARSNAALLADQIQSLITAMNEASDKLDGAPAAEDVRVEIRRVISHVEALQ